MTKELKEKFTDLTALLIAVGALWKATVELQEQLKGAGSKIWENWPWYVISTLVFLAVLFWRRDRLIRWFVPRSTVVVTGRDAFQIGRKYLLGREDDVERLFRILAEWPLVFLVGESGAGKSSLLERGVLPQLRQIPGQIPILINSWGPDWIEGPREALAQSLDPLLDEPLRKLLDLKGPVAPAEALRILGHLRSKAQRTPVLLFDQVDDYQTRHQEKFLDGPQRTLLNADELAKRNPFWGEVKNLISKGAVRCLFTTRSDAKIGLECLRFQEPKVYLLDPLEKSAAADLLAKISKDAVDHPERSFEQLRDRLLDDLASDGWVLPIQMQVAFSGLADLRLLSVGEYERQGGLSGLEALYLESRISAVERAVGGLSKTDIRNVLLMMVDPAAKKTVARTAEQLQVSLARKDPSQLNYLLDKLEVDEVVRHRIDPGEEGSVWQLDHDYLSSGLLMLDRRNRKWPLYLEEAAHSYQGSRNPFERWRRLLPPVRQIRLLYEHFRGSLSYGEYAAYARLSTVRLLVWIIVPLLALYGWREFDAQRTARSLFAGFRETETMELGELRALWKLAGERRRDVRLYFLDAAFEEPSENAARFSGRGEFPLHAVVGFRVEDRESVLKRIVRGRCLRGTAKNAPLDPATVAACTKLIEQIGAPSGDVKRFLPRKISAATRLVDLRETKEMMASLPSPVDQELSGLLSRKALELFNGNIQLGSMGGAFENDFFREIQERELKSFLLVPERRRVAELLLTDMRAGGKLTPSLSRSGPWGDSLTLSERKEILDKILYYFDKSLEGGEGMALYRCIEGSVQEHDARRVLDLLLKRKKEVQEVSWFLQNSPDLLAVLKSGEARSVLEAALGHSSLHSSLYSSLYSSRLESINERVISRLEGPDSYLFWKACLERLSEGTLTIDRIAKQMTYVSNKLSDREVLVASFLALEYLRNARNAWRASTFIKALGSFGKRVPEDMAREASNLFISTLRASPLPEHRLTADSLGVLGLALSGPAADPSVGLLLAELSGPDDDGIKSSLVRSLLVFAGTMSESRVQETVNLISRKAGSLEGSAWTKLVKQLEPRMTTSEVEQILKALVAQPEGLDVWGAEMVKIFGARVDPVFLDRSLERWIQENRFMSVPNCEEAAPLIRNPKAPYVIDLLKWPTCSPESRIQIIRRLDDLLPDSSFQIKGTASYYRADIWGKFVPWAKMQSLDLDSPPKLPDFDKLKINGEGRFRSH
jgi:hypothetical protein